MNVYKLKDFCLFFKLAACKPMNVIFQFLLNSDLKTLVFLENIVFKIPYKKWEIFQREFLDEQT